MPGDRPEIDNANRLDAICLDFVGLQDPRGFLVHFAGDCREPLVPVFAFFFHLQEFHFVEAEGQLGLVPLYLSFFHKDSLALVFNDPAHCFGLLAAAGAEDCLSAGGNGGGAGPQVGKQVGHVQRRGGLQFVFDGPVHAAVAGGFEGFLQRGERQLLGVSGVRDERTFAGFNCFGSNASIGGALGNAVYVSVERPPRFPTW